MGSSIRAIFFSTFISIGGLIFGWDIGYISGCLIMPDFIDRFGEMGADGVMALSAVRQSEITSLLAAGTFFGALAQAFTADRFGRKWSVLVWSVVFTIGVTIQTASTYSVGQLIAGRFIAGLGVGALSALVPLYSGEAAPKHLRGTLLVLYQVQIVFGIFLSYLVALGTHDIPGSASWRIPVGLQIFWGVILIFGVLGVPESPRHLLNIGRQDLARESIASLNSSEANSPLVDDILAELLEGIEEENKSGTKGWRACFAPDVRMRTINGMALQCLQQWCGQNFYYYYGDTFFQSSGAQLSPYVIQVILGAVSFAMVIPAMYTVETVGRRKSLLWGAVVQGTCALIAGLVGWATLAPVGTPDADLTSRNISGGRVLIVFAAMHVGTFNLTWGPTCWAYLGESFPLRVRAKSIALGSASNWFFNFILGFFSPRIAADPGVGPLVLLMFFVALVLSFIYVFFFIPEVKGLSLEQVDELYKAKISPWNSAKWQPTLGTTRKAAFQRTYYASETKGDTGTLTPLEEEDRIRAKGYDDEKIEHVNVTLA